VANDELDQGVRAMQMRGGTSKGLFFVADDLPTDVVSRDAFLLGVMGSPDERQIDGVGGGHPLTSKVAVVCASAAAEADLDYLFLQVSVDEALVSDRQNCGNMLAGVAPFALERGLVAMPSGDHAELTIRLLNTGGIATATVQLQQGRVTYSGDTSISGVPGTAAAIRLDFDDTAGSSCGALLPTGNVVDTIQGVDVTLIDNGMPVVVMRAAAMGVTGTESPAELEANAPLRQKLEAIRLEAGPLMGLGDVADTTVPKLTMVSAPVAGGAVNTRTFIPHRCHDAIGVLGAVSVATACRLPGSPGHQIAAVNESGENVVVEHPTGMFEAAITLRFEGDQPIAERSGIIRTARKLMDGVVFPATELFPSN
jgi:4-oxalomesaconate tautomerase